MQGCVRCSLALAVFTLIASNALQAGSRSRRVYWRVVIALVLRLLPVHMWWWWCSGESSPAPMKSVPPTRSVRTILETHSKRKQQSCDSLPDVPADGHAKMFANTRQWVDEALLRLTREGAIPHIFPVTPAILPSGSRRAMRSKTSLLPASATVPAVEVRSEECAAELEKTGKTE